MNHPPPPWPAYRDLPRIDALDAGHAWNHFGPDDQLGTVSSITDEKVLASLTEARDGQRIRLSIEASAIDPPLFGRDPLVHVLIEADRNTWDDKFDDLYPQAGSQWDSLRHIRAREFGFYGGRTDALPDLGIALGIHVLAERGIVTRGVLLDVAEYLSVSGYDPMTEHAIDHEVLEAVAAAQGVDIQRGDVLCIRTGWLGAYRGLPADARVDLARTDRLPEFAGLAATEDMAARLWDWGVAAVAVDNPGAEVSPGDPAVGSLHRRLIPLLGMTVGELFDLDELASASRADGRWTFLFVSVPLNVAGGVGSPANAVAIR